MPQALKSFLSSSSELQGDLGHVQCCFHPFRDRVIFDAKLGMVCTKHAKSSKIILSHTLELIWNVGHVRSCFDPSGGSVNLGAFLGHGLSETSHMCQNQVPSTTIGRELL